VEGPILGSAALADPTVARAPTVAILPELGGSTARVEGYTLPKSLYYHQGHAWVAVQESGTALIGIDDFTAKLFGQPNSVTLPRLGERFRQGEKGWTLSRGGKDLEMVFPLDGEVIALNEPAAHSPEILSKEPYGRGWLVMVKTKDLKRNLRNLLRGSVATKWMEESARPAGRWFGRPVEIGGLARDRQSHLHGRADEIVRMVNPMSWL
jgi:glycine cleavage system H lipoate-binding protein